MPAIVGGGPLPQFTISTDEGWILCGQSHDADGCGDTGRRLHILLGEPSKPTFLTASRTLGDHRDHTLIIAITWCICVAFSMAAKRRPLVCYTFFQLSSLHTFILCCITTFWFGTRNCASTARSETEKRPFGDMNACFYARTNACACLCL